MRFRGVRLVEQTQQKCVLFSVSVKKTSHCNSCAPFFSQKTPTKNTSNKKCPHTELGLEKKLTE